MNTGFLTTINTNIGDDFIRIGIENIIKSVRKSKPVKFTYVNKHHPEQVLSEYSPLHLLHKLPGFRGKKRLENLYYSHLHKYFNVFKNQNVIIQSGAPVLWPNCFISEWNEPVWFQTIGKLYKKIPVLNLAAGSCYPWENQNGFLNSKEKDFASRIGSYCKLTTTRDKLANALFFEAGISNTLIPCSAFLVNTAMANPESGKYILINYMSGGGHFDWDQNVNASEWETTVVKLIDTLKDRHEIRFICHNQKEAELSQKLYPGIKVHYPASVDEYLECIKFAKAGICNRMHASVAMASHGVPSISICTDTRLLMLELIGLPVFYVKNAGFDELLNATEKAIDNVPTIRKSLFELKEQTLLNYQEILRPYFG